MLFIVLLPAFSLKFSLDTCILVLIFGITSKSFEMFSYRSFTEICALILMEMSAWKADLSGDIDGAVMLL